MIKHDGKKINRALICSIECAETYEEMIDKKKEQSNDEGFNI